MPDSFLTVIDLQFKKVPPDIYIRGFKCCLRLKLLSLIRESSPYVKKFVVFKR